MRFSKILTLTIVTLLTLITFCSCSFLSECDFINSIYDLIDSWFPCEHENSEWRIVENATCETEGYRVNVCNDCGEEIGNATIDMLPHTIVNDKAVAPTCSKEGLSAGKHCADCGKILVAQVVIEKKSHTIVTDEAVEPTCETTGLTEGSHCSVCDEVIVAQTVIDALGHDTPILLEPTCTKYGYTVDACTVCGKSSDLTIIAPLGHKMELQNSSYDPECEKDGLNNYKCSVCGITESEIIPMLGHKAVETHCPATCYEAGKTLTFCSVCNKELVEPVYDADKTLDPNNHHEIEIRITTPATCTSEGALLKYCTYCNYLATEIIPITHNWVKGDVVPPNCENDGYTIYTCKDCGATENRDFVNKLPHDYTGRTETILPVCGNDGYTICYCQRTGCDSYVKEVIEYDRINPDHHGGHGKPAPVCNNPDHKYYSGVDVAHGDAACDCTGSSIIKEPTDTSIGLEQYQCESCGSRYYVVNPALSDEKE